MNMIKVIMLVITILSVMFFAEAATVGCDRAGGVKCQKVNKPYKSYKRAKVIVIPRSHLHYHAYHTPLLSALGLAIVLDAAGNAVTNKGDKVVVLGEGNEVKNVYEKDGVVYLIKEQS
ncbi:hypothetical protein CXF83_14350 [Shewanella sp. Choline-02u-19]|nr:hypothetical protein CXF82_12210 [Shewanella sp. GutDb-MelDb]PKG72614.1 hypothetical protein CXF86_22030 [Shewanella sp. GutCb]PKH57007.1 hypothetical protein CXF84_11060 [Shewanella sp. Bg11-22]PKI27804.1 hypothetical protein CXF83_14350 [Shewanella sp. Choline-02u-19]